MLMYVEGGLFRRRSRWSGRREAISDEQARQHYLDGFRIPVAAPIVDAGAMEPLPLYEPRIASP
jgi:hypothetical protein